MAGGRRPASYVSGARHNTGIDRGATFDQPTTPPLTSGPGPSLPLWIPSIWQPPPLTSSSGLSTEDPGVPVTPTVERPRTTADSSALAAALDSAVQSAVVRVLGQSQNSTPSRMHDLSISEQTLENGESPNSTKLRELEGLVELLQSRLNERNQDIGRLSNRLEAMEAKMLATEEAGKRREEQIAMEMKSLVRSLGERTSESEKRLMTRMNGAQEQMRINLSGINKLKSAQKHFDEEQKSVKKRVQKISGEMRQLELSICADVERKMNRMEQLESTFKNRFSQIKSKEEKDDSAYVKVLEFEKLKRQVEANADAVGGMRPKLKRVESQVTDVAKQANDASALNHGFQQGMKDNVVKVTEAIEGLGASVSQLRQQIVNCDNLDQKKKVEDRLDGLETNVKGLKKLIETNLRTSKNAEVIVKEQVSLITKHVCVAMRQYTTRRIADNNVLIDQALRARVPDYAKNEGQFVLVREQDKDGNESIEIQRSSEVSTAAPA